ncbi:hypothetical protein GY45DRAFT_1372775 [Cubamyces sp. BRFM 1775]|nr:hypothetical protein GY45DRAFT_1372775 [Cubamyces sp. BRFM 1775]
MELHWEEDDDRRDVPSEGSCSGNPHDDVSILSRAATSTSSSEGSTEPDTDDAVGDILAEMNIFGDPTHDVELFPLVDLWFELTDHLKQEDIPNPMELYKERDEIVRIIEDACTRANAAINVPLTSKPNGDTDDARDDGAAKEAKPTARIHPKALLRSLMRKGGHTLGRMKRALRVPYIPAWP